MNYNRMDPHPRINKKHHKILIAGAGGLGCEIVKNMSTKTIQNYEISIIDDDTVAQTNLNRQFCFRREDIGKAKVDVLKDYFTKINPSLQLSVYKKNLLHFSISFFNQFDLLVGCLDNRQAREFLNKMAIRNGIPMIDAGTSGFNGQVQSHIRYESQCRFCRPQFFNENSSAVCSIRNRPTRNIHCVHYALELFKDLFGSEKKTIISHKEKKLNKNELVTKWGEQAVILHNQHFSGSFISEAEQRFFPVLLETDSGRQIILKYGTFLTKDQQGREEQLFEIKNLENYWSQHHFSEWFVICFISIMQESFENQQFSSEAIEYDKDNITHSVFLHCVINLRILNFMKGENSYLKPLTFYESKDLLGNIIPAIASTNAIAASLEVIKIESFIFKDNLMNRKGISKKQFDDIGKKFGANNKEELLLSNSSKYFSIRGFLSNDFPRIEPIIPQKPKQNCNECSFSCLYGQIQCNIHEVSFGELEKFLHESLPQENFRSRDMRCEDFIVIRNGFKPLHKNIDKKLDFSPSLLHKRYDLDREQSLIEKTFINVKYLPCPNFERKWEFEIEHVQYSQKNIDLKFTTYGRYSNSLHRQEKF